MNTTNINHTKMKLALICGMLGCLCMGGGDWLMIYGNPESFANLYWLTEGVAAISSWRYSLAMLLSFPGIIFYGIGLFALQNYIASEKQRKIYHYLNAFGLTPWMALHLFYVMIFSLFAWLNHHGYADHAVEICEALFSQLSWFVMASEALMLPVFLYWFVLQISGKTVFPRWVAFFNVLVIYGLLYVVRLFLPVSAFRMGFINGMMSESMVIWFGMMLIYEFCISHKEV